MNTQGQVAIIFTIIIAVQFVVITKGSTRVAEVAARFTLDALPGKQMAIEAEYNSGLVSAGNLTKFFDNKELKIIINIIKKVFIDLFLTIKHNCKAPYRCVINLGWISKPNNNLIMEK